MKMKNLYILFANIFDMKDDVSKLLWQCCTEHELKIEFAMNLDEVLERLKQKRYHGLILGNYPEGARYSGIYMMQRVRQIPGYEHMPTVILTKFLNEFIYDMQNADSERLLIVPIEELKHEKIFKIVHEHFLGLNQ